MGVKGEEMPYVGYKGVGTSHMEFSGRRLRGTDEAGTGTRSSRRQGRFVEGVVCS